MALFEVTEYSSKLTLCNLEEIKDKIIFCCVYVFHNVKLNYIRHPSDKYYHDYTCIQCVDIVLLARICMFK